MKVKVALLPLNIFFGAINLKKKKLMSILFLLPIWLLSSSIVNKKYILYFQQININH